MPTPEAKRQARRLVDQIVRHALALDHRALLTLDADPDTAISLGLLPPTATRAAKLHLDGARIWHDQQTRKALDRLEAAQTALDGLDISLAKGLLRRIDSSFLGDSDLARLDELLLATEARATELEDIEGRLPSSSLVAKPKRRGRFRKR